MDYINEVKEVINDLGGPKEVVGGFVAWAGLFFIVFMLTVVCG